MVRNPTVDRPVLVGNLVSGGLWLLFPLGLGAWPLSLVGATYVVPASLLLAIVSARPSLTRTQRALAGAVAWLGAVAIWAVLIGSMSTGGTQDSRPALAAGAVVGTLCFLAWQLVAFPVRHQYLGWITRGSPQVAALHD